MKEFAQNLEKGGGAQPVTPASVKEKFERRRIVPGDDFQSLYSTFRDDMEKALRLRKMYEQQASQDDLGFLGEALVFDRIEQGALGGAITARGTSEYDDLFHGADIAIESKARQQRDPIISAVDVTISQPSLDAATKSLFESDGIVFEFGLDKKLGRVKRHIDELSKFSPKEAIEIVAWLQSGGFSQPRTESNRKKFEVAEKLLLLKYYKNPTTSEDPDKPHFVLAGPQVVVSIDRSFVNKVFYGNQQERALKDIDTLLQAEVPLAVGMVTNYVDSIKKSGKTNLLLDMTHAACRSWEITFTEEIYANRIEKALLECRKNPSLMKQVVEYQKALVSAFGVK